MMGSTIDGLPVQFLPKKITSRIIPAGKLSPICVRDLQATITSGLLAQGYSRDQVAQVMNSSLRTSFRRVPNLPPKTRV